MMNRETIRKVDVMSDNSYQNGFSKTWMLFESGNGVVVGLSLFSPPRESLRPIDAYVVTEVEGTVTHSARRAAGAAYEAISRFKKDLGSVVAGFDFDIASPVTGESGGLAFAVALAKRLVQKDPGPVAATGIVQSSDNGGPVKGVRGIESKLKAAVIVIPPGGWILYPSENDDEVSPKLRQYIARKGIKARAVRSVAEAIDILFESENAACAKFPARNAANEKPGSNKFFSPVYMLFLLLVFSASVTMAIWKNNGFAPAHVAMETRTSSETGIKAGESWTGGVPAKKVAEQFEADENHFDGKKDTDEGNGIDGQATAAAQAEPGSASEASGIEDPPAELPETNPMETVEAATGPKTGGKQQPGPADDDSLKVEERSPIVVDMIGRSRLNSRISQALEKKLKTFFAERNRRIYPEEKIEISGQVVVLRIEESWEEEKQSYCSNLKVAIRDFRYQDEKRTIDRASIESDLHSDGPVEELISRAAQDLMSQILHSAPSEQKPATDQSVPDSPNPPSKKTEQERKTGFE